MKVANFGVDITWPIGKDAIVKFVPHDSIGTSEVLPRCFSQRVDRCCQIVCGIVKGTASGLHIAFCGRKSPGTYVMQYAPKGFQNAHGARHLCEYRTLGWLFSLTLVLMSPFILPRITHYHRWYIISVAIVTTDSF